MSNHNGKGAIKRRNIKSKLELKNGADVKEGGGGGGGEGFKAIESRRVFMIFELSPPVQYIIQTFMAVLPKFYTRSTLGLLVRGRWWWWRGGGEGEGVFM